MIALLLFVAICFLAYSNGANDTAKGVASLLASGTVDYRSAILWGTSSTLAGSLASVYLSVGLLDAFSGKGLVPNLIAGQELFLLSVAAGAGGTVILATTLGLPISTTHALVGAIVGAGYLAAGSALNLQMLTSVFLLPLFASPLLALLAAGLLYKGLRRARKATGVRLDSCVCAGQLDSVAVGPGSGATAMRSSLRAPVIAIATTGQCENCYPGSVAGVSWQRLLDNTHFLSAGLVGFARGLNDTPKIAALLLVLRTVDIRWGMLAIASAMAAGGLLNARKVALTMGQRITTMSHGQGLTASLTTGLMVIVASRFGVPVSTTHVSAGSLFGIGMSTGQADLAVIRTIALSWWSLSLVPPCWPPLPTGWATRRRLARDRYRPFAASVSDQCLRSTPRPA